MAKGERKCSYKPCGKKSISGIRKGPQFWCSSDCVVKYAMEGGRKLLQKQQKSQDKAEKETRKQWAKDKREYLASKLSHQIELTRKVFNTMIRLLDRGKRCPTCGEPLIEGEYDAGHARTVASCPQIRFHPCACFGQCRSCNGSGTIRKRTKKTQEVVSELYKAWVLETLGQAHYDWLYGPHPEKHWLIHELIEQRAVFSAEVTRLKAGLEPSRNWRQLPTTERSNINDIRN